MARVTTGEMYALAARASRAAISLGIVAGDDWHDVDTSIHNGGMERYRSRHLELMQGSPTYGQAWRLITTGGADLRTAHGDDLRLGDGYLGATRAEAYAALRGIVLALEAAVVARAGDAAAIRGYRELVIDLVAGPAGTEIVTVPA